MAAFPQADPSQQQGPPQAPQGGGSPAAPNTGAVVQIMDGLNKLSTMLGQVFPAASEEAQGIQKLVNQAQVKIAATQSQTQPQAPPI
jgi:hypothetical protein